ncbi:hypothetical protein EDC56_3771 [Sinobacterium caligoides]|uniref:ATP-cone domain-containing protein n=1 Tax=Sinobacterium caligoides TaxID=933926 RepID=A0A3N2D564_9GAMM|nr:hypothetical protein [Sinobacterium caligoides]ROR94956.1 hypothetical protein EDC56_3771 [Sinobacterium caligoides]
MKPIDKSVLDPAVKRMLKAKTRGDKVEFDDAKQAAASALEAVKNVNTATYEAYKHCLDIEF